MNDYNVTFRHARNAVDLIVNGAVRQIESHYAAADSPECQAAITELIEHIREELNCWEPMPT